MFDIHLTDEAVSDLEPGAKAVYGKIRIDEYQETIVASLVFWTPAQYQHHWEISLRRIVDGADRSALITSYAEPVTGGFLWWWPLYRDRESVHLQNQMLFFDQLSRPFSSEKPWDSVGDRKAFTSEGLPISQWVTTMQSIREFLGRK